MSRHYRNLLNDIDFDVYQMMRSCKGYTPLNCLCGKFWESAKRISHIVSHFYNRPLKEILMFAANKDNKVDAAKDGMLNEGGHMMNDGKDGFHSLTDEAHDALAATKNDWRGTVQRTGQHAHDLMDSAGHNLAHVRQATVVRIRDKPVQSSLIALGVGFVVGKLFRR